MGHLYIIQWKLQFKLAFACVKEGIKVCQDALWHLCTVKSFDSKWWFDKFAQIGQEKSSPSARLSAGEGVQSLFGQCLTYMWCCNLWCVTQVWLRLGMWRMAEGGVAEVWHTEIPTINTPRHQDTKTPRYQDTKSQQKRSTSISLVCSTYESKQRKVLLQIDLVCVVFVSLRIRLDSKNFPSDSRTKPQNFLEIWKPLSVMCLCLFSFQF